MITYKYIARDYEGQIKEGYTKAASETDVLSWLREQDCTPVSVDAVNVSVGLKRKRHIPVFQSITSGELAAVFWQLNAMIDGGITIAESLEGIAEDMDNVRFQKILLKMLETVERGGSVSESLEEYPEVFNKLVCSLVLAGETGGNIAEAFRRVAVYYTERDRLKRKVKKAMAYPVFVLIFVVLVVIAMMTLIIPQFRKMFESFGQENLPAFTETFMAFYDVIVANWYYIIGFIVVSIISTVILYKNSAIVHRLFSRLFLRIPIFGDLIKQAFYATFCKTMSNLLRGGVPVLEAFQILSDMNANDIIREKLEQTREGIVSGMSICASMSKANFFPNMCLKMVKAGEDSGSLWKTLDKTSDYYEDKVDAMIASVTSLLEPLMIIIVGVIVLVVVLALYLPVFQISDIRAG